MDKQGEIRICSSDIVDEVEGRSKIVFKIEKDKEIYELHYEVDNKYKGFACAELADCVVVSFLSYAMRGGYDIISDIPISEKLYYQMRNCLIPQFFAATKNAYNTKLICQYVDVDYNPCKVAMAMSCGLDSLTSYYQSISDDAMKSYSVNMFTFFQNGAHHSGNLGRNSKESEIFESQLKRVERFCEKVDVPLLVVRSNINDLLGRLFWDDSYQNTHSFRNAGFVLLFQKLIKVYYYAGVYDICEFDGSLRSGDAAHFDHFLFPNVSTQNISFYVTNSVMTRIEKIQYLRQFPETYDSLLVCYNSGNNCGICLKCKRTLVELDFADALDCFGSSFEIQNYMLNRKKYILWAFMKKNRDVLCGSIYQYAKDNKLDIPKSWCFFGAIFAKISDLFLPVIEYLKKSIK